MSVSIKAIGTAVPQWRQSQAQTARFMAQLLGLDALAARQLNVLYAATKIEYRHSVLADYAQTRGNWTFFPNEPIHAHPATAKRMELYAQHAPELALQAINACLQQVEAFDHPTLTHLITVSCTGLYAPGLDIAIIERLALSPAIKRTSIQFMGCCAAFNALDVANSICSADPSASVLMVCVELCSLHFQPGTRHEELIANAIFSDGAAAVLINSSPPPQGKSLRIIDCYSEVAIQGKQDMAWQIGNHGFEMTLSAYVPKLLGEGIAGFVERLMVRHNLNQEAIQEYAIHPGGVKILKACETALGISAADNRHAYQVLRDFGNMSSATILFVLQALLNNLTAADHGKRVFSCAFGPGLSMQSTLLQVNCV